MVGTGKCGDEQLEPDREGERLVGARTSERDEILRPGATREDIAVGDGPHRDVCDERVARRSTGRRSRAGSCPSAASPPSGAGSRRGEVAVSSATSLPSARRRTQYPSAPVGKQGDATTSRAPSISAAMSSSQIAGNVT